MRQSIDRGRQRLRLAGNVRNEGDGRAKLAHGSREREDHARDNAGRDQRQRHGEKDPERARAERSGGRFQLRIDRLGGQPDRAHHEREPHDGAGKRRARPAKRKDNAEILIQKGSDGAFPPEGEEQEIAGHDRRHDERKMHDPVDSAFPQKSRRASAMATPKPKGRLAAMATVATRRLSLMAVHSSGLSVHQSFRIVSPFCYFRTVKP